MAWSANSSAKTPQCSAYEIARRHNHAPVHVVPHSQRLVAGDIYGGVGRTTLNMSNCHFTTAMSSTIIKQRHSIVYSMSPHYPQHSRTLHNVQHPPILDSDAQTVCITRHTRCPIIVCFFVDTVIPSTTLPTNLLSCVCVERQPVGNGNTHYPCPMPVSFLPFVCVDQIYVGDGNGEGSKLKHNIQTEWGGG